MMFRTQYDRQRVTCEPGSRIHKTYGGHYDEKGRVVLEETGEINLYDEIQSHAESVDIHVLMKRYANGDAEALSKQQGFCESLFCQIRNPAKRLSEKGKKLT